MNISLDAVEILAYHRAIKPYSLRNIIASMTEHGYNNAYPIMVDSENRLVDGRHRIEAARQLGIAEIPYTTMPDGESSIRFSLLCNADGQLCQADDVFDFAELCWSLSRAEWTGQQIADELGWTTGKVGQYKGIRDNLHPMAWYMARFTRDSDFVKTESEGVVNPEFTIVNWSESHFRALLKHLSHTDGDKAIMRAQMKAIRACIARANEKDKRFGQTGKTLTAKWIGGLAERLAWHVKLAKHMRDSLVKAVPLRERINLLKSVYSNVFGEKESEKNFEKFDKAVMALNEKALGIVLYCDDAFQRVPLLDDKSIALVVTDPPYNTTEHSWDQIGTDEEFLDFTANWLDALEPKLAADFHIFFFCAPEYQARVENVIKNSELPLLSRIVWSNRSLPAGRGVVDRFVSTWQMVFHIGSHELNWPPEWSDNRFDVQVYAAPNANTDDGGYHPTPKPVAFLEHLVKLGSKPADKILDLFAGGGATGAAASQVGQRQCILIEREEAFCSNIEGRLNIKRSGD